MIRLLFYRLCWIAVRLYLVMYHRYTVYNRQRAPREPGVGMIVAANHSSYIDPCVVGNAFRHPLWFLARTTLFHQSRFFTWLITWLNAVPISRVRLDIVTLHRVQQLCFRGEWVLIFPEGTRTKDGELQKGMAGVGMLADKLGVDIIPVYHEGSYESWSRYMQFPWPKPISVNIGEPLRVKQWDHIAPGREKYQAIADDLMQAIEDLKIELHELREAAGGRVRAAPADERSAPTSEGQKFLISELQK